MTPEAFQLAIAHLVEGGLRLPHGFVPGACPDGQRAFPAQLDWDFYQWNPPEYLVGVEGFEDYGQLDPDASPKPTWDAIRSAYEAARLGPLRAELIDRANAQAKRRIAIAYAGVDDRLEELTQRLNGRATAAQDAERLRLIAVCHALEERIGVAETVEALEATDVTTDAAWAVPLTRESISNDPSATRTTKPESRRLRHPASTASCSSTSGSGS